MSEFKRAGDCLDTVEAICRECREPYRYLRLDLPGTNWIPDICESCQRKHDPVIVLPSAQALERERRVLAWQQFCPPKYRTLEEGGETDPARLPKDLLAEVLRWSPQDRPRGLFIAGMTGRCKTRCLWRLLRRMFMAGFQIRYFGCMEFALQCSHAFREGTEIAWMEAIHRADVVVLDDLWKDPMTDRVDGEVFRLVNKFSEQCKPVFVTTNWNEEALTKRASDPSQRMSIDRIEPLFRRLGEDCRPIQA